MSAFHLFFHDVYVPLLLLFSFVPVNHAWISPAGRRMSATATRIPSLPLHDAVLMPDGGVSPCVIRVIGVGGGGCNAVRNNTCYMVCWSHPSAVSCHFLQRKPIATTTPRTCHEPTKVEFFNDNLTPFFLNRTVTSQVERMLDKTVDGIEYWAINSDHQALSRSKAKGAKTLSIGATVTRGLGAGGDPAKGQLAAEENMAELAEIVEGADLVFITAGMVRSHGCRHRR